MVDVELGTTNGKYNQVDGVHRDNEIKLEWSNLSYSVKMKDHDNNGVILTKQLLHPMSGCAQPGECLGIMGTSGAGEHNILMIILRV
jgi:ABC-type multidrug transport system ATPase subunit